MGLFSTYQCRKCGHTFESCLDFCAKCGAIAYRVSGIAACLASARPPGYAGGKHKPYSARSYDERMAENFKTLHITNVTHKEGPNGEKVPVCSFERPPLVYDSAPNPNPGQKSFPIRAYHSPDAMQAAISEWAGAPVVINQTVEGRPFATPAVHPTFQVGSAFSARSPQTTLKDRTVIVARHKE
jgi:hypothetical protein